MEGTRWPIYEENLDLPFAFEWGSDIPHAGNGFEEWTNVFLTADSLGNTIVLKGYFFRDETNSLSSGKKLARKRIERVIRYLDLNRERVLTEVLPAELKSDVKSSLFEALSFEIILSDNLWNTRMDTAEICFPLKDSFLLTSALWNQLDTWASGVPYSDTLRFHLTGFADGSGIAESADMGWERAMTVKKRLLTKGYKEDQIQIETDQRVSADEVRNRCVTIYYE